MFCFNGMFIRIMSSSSWLRKQQTDWLIDSLIGFINIVSFCQRKDTWQCPQQHGWPSTQPGILHTALQRKYTQPCSLFSRGTAVRTMGARLCEQWGPMAFTRCQFHWHCWRFQSITSRVKVRSHYVRLRVRLRVRISLRVRTTVTF